MNTLIDMAVDEGVNQYDMTVEKRIINGLSETQDNAPYLLRISGGDNNANVGEAMIDKIIGGTFSWNQLINNSGYGTLTNDGITTSYDSTTHMFSITNDSRTTNYSSGSQRNSISDLIIGHKYVCFGTNASGIAISPSYSSPSVGVKQLPTIFEANSANAAWRVTAKYDFVNAHPVGDTFSFYLNLVDLTQALGPTIADYIYSLEQSTVGAGVAWFRNLFPKDYYEYDTGTLMSVKASAHNMVGFNAYDSETGKAKVVGNNQYQITGTYTALLLGGVAITPDVQGLFTPSANGELIVTGGNATDTCIHLVWSGYRNGEYEEYDLHRYPLDSNLELRGIPKLDANNNLYYDGDTYEPDGTVTRRYGIVDLGTLTGWRSNMNGTNAIEITHELAGKAYGRTNIICDKLNTIMAQSATDIAEYSIRGFPSSDLVAVKVPKSVAETASAVQEWIANNHPICVYELATPTAETADAFTNPQKVDKNGTEEYVDEREVPIPVGHETRYPIPVYVAEPEGGAFDMDVEVQYAI